MQAHLISLLMLASMGLTRWPARVRRHRERQPTLLFLIAGGMMLVCGVGTRRTAPVLSLR
jgi:hypothetical protein